jgi:hypothetical protein
MYPSGEPMAVSDRQRARTLHLVGRQTMTSTGTTCDDAPIRLAAWRDTVVRVVLVLLAVGAVVAFFGGLSSAQETADGTRWVESWRAVGFLTFAALFVLVALRPRGVPGVWEILLANKTALAITALFESNADERSAGLVDAVLALLIAVAYVLARGWMAWSKREPAGR